MRAMVMTHTHAKGQGQRSQWKRTDGITYRADVVGYKLVIIERNSVSRLFIFDLRFYDEDLMQTV